MINYDDMFAGTNFGGGSYGNNLTLTSMNIAAVPEASAFVFGGIVCCMLGAAHVRRKIVASP